MVYILLLMLIGCAIASLFAIQLGGNAGLASGGYFDLAVSLSLLYPLNIILLYVRVIRQKVCEMADQMRTNPPQYSSPILIARAFTKKWVIFMTHTDTHFPGTSPPNIGRILSTS